MIINDVHVGIQKNKKRKRIGRGTGSGHGKTAGRGHKGFYSRAGSSRRTGFEGGQMPLFRRVAKRGFNNSVFAPEVATINVAALNSLPAGTDVTPEFLIGHGLIPTRFDLLKILGDGEITVSLTVQAHRFSASAVEKIQKAGGKVVILSSVTVGSDS
ncbi:MAG: 50S ribosomal protein L15 [Planctomyces sp.]